MSIPGSITARRSGLAVAFLCFAIIVADGYDMVIYGAALPELLDEPGWHLSKSTAGLIGSWTLGGLMLGFLAAGPLADRRGRRSALFAGIILFSAGSLLSALAPSVAVFGVSRFITGVGIGAVVPSAVALTLEYAPPKRRMLYNGAMLTGFSFGGILASLVAMWMLPHLHWRSLFWVAACFIVLLPVMYLRLPESVEYLVRSGRLDEARALAAQYGRQDTIDGAVLAASAAPTADRQGGLRTLATSSMVVRVVLFVLISICVNVMVYGLNTWAPALMRSQGYALGSSLQFLLALQAGGVIGAVIGSYFADRVGPGKVVPALFLIGVVALAVLTNKMDTGLLLVAIVFAGIGGTGTNTVLYGFVANNFPENARGSALGVIMGLGRTGAMLGPAVAGWILDAGHGASWAFYAFMIPGAIGAVLALAVPVVVRRRRESLEPVAA
ncbi:MFS transporter [Tsukamurella sp. NPDC003166]|uniref:MFS transporter n=1 Tax=Tsukamurella sp. NPDC003166 TaxID=3154444 RepID=UPI0033AE191B